MERPNRPIRFGASAPLAARAVALAALLGLTGCAALRERVAGAPGDAIDSPTAPVTPAARSAAPTPTPALAVEPAGPTPGPFAEVVARAGERLVQDARAAVGPGPRDVVIDPLIDASSGQQTAGTVQLGQQLSALIKQRAPQWTVRPLTRASLTERPLLLIGTLTPIHVGAAKDAKDGRGDVADAFRVCLVLIDLGTGKLVAKRVERATVASVNAEPIGFFRESPTWTLDRTALAYVKSCQGSSPGDSISPAYLLRLPAAAITNEAMAAFADNRHADAYKLFREAQAIAAPDDLRVLNGLYMTSWKSGKKKEATETFGRIVGIGLEAKRLPIKIFFAPGSTQFIASPDLQAQYVVWIKEIALQAGVRETCMKVVGHTSRTGTAAANEALSLRRATQMKQVLERLSKELGPRLEAVGVGSREAIIGLGTDDARDALDRRVEFRTVDCS